MTVADLAPLASLPLPKVPECSLLVSCLPEHLPGPAKSCLESAYLFLPPWCPHCPGHPPVENFYTWLHLFAGLFSSNGLWASYKERTCHIPYPQL